MEPITVYTHTPRRRIQRIRRIWLDFDGERAKYFGIASIVCGILSVVADAIGILYYNESKHQGGNLFITGWGYWCPIFFWTSGCIAIAAGNQKTDRLLKALLGTSIVSIWFGLELFGSSLAMLIILANNTQNENGSYDVIQPKTLDHRYYVQIAMAAVLLVLGCLEIVWSVCLCVLCGPHLCCNRVPPIEATPLFKEKYETRTNPDGTMTQYLVQEMSPTAGVDISTGAEADDPILIASRQQTDENRDQELLKV